MMASKSVRGFSLLEVLIAMAISSLLYVGGYTVLDSVLTTNEVVSNQTEKLRKVQRAYHFIQKDIEQIIARPIRDQFGERLPAVDYSFGAEGGLEFTRLGWRNPVNRPRSNLQRVAYRVEDDILIRDHWLVLDRSYDTEAKASEILPGVTELKLRFYNAKEKSWTDSWPPEKSQVKMLPKAIEMILLTEDFGELRRIFRVVDNPSSSSRLNRGT